MSESTEVEKTEVKTSKMFVCTAEEWGQLMQVIGAVPSQMAAGAYLFMAQKHMVDVTL